jgi:hypothetical protein
LLQCGLDSIFIRVSQLLAIFFMQHGGLVTVYVCGFVTLLIGLYHMRLHVFLNWKEKLNGMELYDQKVFYTINIALAIIFFIISILSFVYAKELSRGSGLAFGFNLSFFCFWIWRFIWGETYQRKGANRNFTVWNIVKKSTGVILAISYLILTIVNY